MVKTIGDMRSSRRGTGTPLRAVVAAGLAIVLALAGCGSSGNKKKAAPSASSAAVVATPNDTGKPLYDKAVAALNAASSFHASGAGTGSSASLKFEMRFGATGSEADLNLGIPVQVVSDGTNVYLKAAADFWDGILPAGTANKATKEATLAPKWVRVDTTGSQFSSYSIFVSKAKFIQTLGNPNTHWGLGGPKTINNVATTELTGSDGTNWFVESSGAGRVIETQTQASATGSPTGSFTISDYDAPFTPPLPAASDVIDYASVVG